MNIVQFKSVQNDGTVKVVATAKMVNGKVKLTSSKPGVLTMLKTDPILGLDRKVKTIEDGLDWLEALPQNYSGSRFFAEEVNV